MTYIAFDKSQLINLEYSLSREILRTNRAGSFASTTIIGCNTRKYHGLLICPLEQFGGENHVLLSDLDETVIEKNKAFNLGIHKYEGDNYSPRGHKYVRDFEAETISRTTFRVGEVVLVKESLLVEHQQQILIQYHLQESEVPITLRLKPFLVFRNAHALSKANDYADTGFQQEDNGISCCLYEGYPRLYMQISKKPLFVSDPDWYYNVEYIMEMERGYDYKEDLFNPGYFELKMKPGDTVVFSASTIKSNPHNLKAKFTSDLGKRVPRTSYYNSLVNAAQQFIVRKENRTEIIAGYPWFGTWGRDTFISLPGLTLSLNDPQSFKAVVDTIVKRMQGGLFPNMGGNEAPAFNSVDAPLWFFWALQQYNHFEKAAKIWKLYGSPMKNIIQGFRDGLPFNIRMQENGLIYAGEEGKALTWMDAVVHDGPVTPRIGMPVEINALWYNALEFALKLAGEAGDKQFVREWESWPEKIKGSFIQTFWEEERGYLADVVRDAEKDWSVRPNMVIATALEYSPLTGEMKKQILDVAESELLTPRGLRTLSPKNPAYRGIYEGDQENRDRSYHQGLVWPWLLEHFCEGYLKLHKRSGLNRVKELYQGFEEEISNHGVGTISEIYDGDPPHRARGAISQAWSVAALLRIHDRIEEYSKEL